MKLFGKEFGKSKQNSDVPADLQQYYNTGGSGVGKLILRIVAFVLIMALIIWGGIWLFDKLTGGNDSETASNNTNQQEESQKASEDRAKADAEAKKAADEAAKKAAEARKKAEEEARKQEAANQTPPAGSTTSPSTSTTQDLPVGGSGGGEPSVPAAELPNSGPGETLVALFVGTVGICALLHSVYTRRRVQQ
jgi:cytoskeletal protein RodZ